MYPIGLNPPLYRLAGKMLAGFVQRSVTCLPGPGTVRTDSYTGQMDWGVMRVRVAAGLCLTDADTVWREKAGRLPSLSRQGGSAIR